MRILHLKVLCEDIGKFAAFVPNLMAVEQGVCDPTTQKRYEIFHLPLQATAKAVFVHRSSLKSGRSFPQQLI